MILQALNDYYGRLRADPESGMSEPGYGTQNVHFALVLTPEGKLAQVQDLREVEGKRVIPKRMPLPEAVTRTVAVDPNFLWDNAKYVLGSDAEGATDRSRQCFEAFSERFRGACEGVGEPAMKAALAFLDNWTPEEAVALEQWADIAGGNLVFRLQGKHEYLHETEAARKAWRSDQASRETGEPAMCLVTGESRPPARLHPAIKGVPGAQSSGARLVSFNLDAFTSYGKEQNYNAPVNEDAAFAYTTALNHLLRRENGHKVQIGDAAVVFWTERASPVEFFLGAALAPKASGAEAEDGGDVQRVHDFLDALRRGRALPEEIERDKDLKFYILGLAPNAARLSVRFWHVGTVRDILDTVGRHFAALEIVRQYDNQPEFPAAWMLLRETAAQSKDDNIPAPLTSGLMRSILTGTAYPMGLLNTLLMRVRADHNVSYLRAAMIKACLVRNHNLEVTVALDTTRTEESYLLGRLFAILEKAQEEAVPNANATIKDRFLGAASATPGRVFPLLLKNSANHLAKLRKDTDKQGRSINLEKQIQAILDGLEGFSSTLSTQDQGLFLLGYYHQRKALFTKKADKAESTATDSE